MISVRKLNKLSEFLELNKSYFNDKITEIKKGKIISIKNPKFPFNLRTKEGAYLLGCIVSDGCIYEDRSSKNILRTKYSSSDNESLLKFKDGINKIFGEVHFQEERIRDKNIYLKIGSSVIGDCLAKAGAPIGNKTKLNPEIPKLIKENPKLQKYYLSAVFSDEGSSAGGDYQPYITLTRYNRLTLDKNEIEIINTKIDPLMKERKFPTGHISKSITYTRVKELTPNIAEKISGEISNLLKNESEILSGLNINNRLWISKLTKTSLGYYSLSTNLFISQKESVIKFYKEIGFSLSRKQIKLEQSLKEAKWINGNTVLQHSDEKKRSI